MANLTGVDASRHQGTVNWQAVKAAGHTFAFIKATDGVAYRHIGWFHQNLPQVHAAGLVPGAYHFLLDHHPGAAQARYFVNEVNKAGGFVGVVPIVDIEREADGTTPRLSHLQDFVHEFWNLVPGRPILIYTGHWYWVGVLHNPWGAHLGPLWHSEYDGQTPFHAEVANGPELDSYGGWQGCLVWQHTSTGVCPGINGSCDLNIFYGDINDLLGLAGAAVYPPVSSPVSAEELLEMPYPVVVVHPNDPDYAGREKWLALSATGGAVHVPDGEYYEVGREVGLIEQRQVLPARKYDVAADFANRLAGK